VFTKTLTTQTPWKCGGSPWRRGGSVCAARWMRWPRGTRRGATPETAEAVLAEVVARETEELAAAEVALTEAEALADLAERLYREAGL
jgi:hypothetical protein